ncbi:hypothetical protein HDU82_000191, partial [Entophlyctis luteolus]
FEGPPTADVLAALAEGKAASTPEHPVALDAALAALIKAKRIHYAKRRGVVFVRICDARRFRELKFAKASQVLTTQMTAPHTHSHTHTQDDAIVRISMPGKRLFVFDDSPELATLVPAGVSAEV